MTMMRAIPTSRCLAPLRRPRAPSTAERLIDRVRSSVIGGDAVLEGPFGPVRFYRAKGNVAAADQLSAVARPSR